MSIAVLAAILIVVGICGGILYLIYSPIKRWLIRTNRIMPKTSRLINRSYLLVLFSFALYQTFEALFPSERLFAEEFKTVTLRAMPQSAKFISKIASYPDFHGDYCSSSQIKLSKVDYQKLLHELQSDRRMKGKSEPIGSEEFQYTLGNKTTEKIVESFTRTIEGEEDHYLYIGFYEDQRTVFVNICVT